VSNTWMREMVGVMNGPNDKVGLATKISQNNNIYGCVGFHL